MKTVHRVENVGGHIKDFATKGAAFEFCKEHQEYRYVGLVYCFN